MDERSKLQEAIAHLEAQRETLGNEVVDSALAPLREELIRLETRGEFPVQQRKQVTILFADIVDSTKISRHLDPEDTRDIFDAALQRLAQPINRHGGHVTRYMGDGFKAVFGSPQAHENDPEQAIRAGLGILKVAQELAVELNEGWKIQDFQVRVGTNTGLVAIGGATEAEDTLMGAPVNLAKRIESAAPPGGLLISHHTYRHVRGVFDIQPIEPISAKGFEQPVPVYQVLRLKTRPLRTYLKSVEGIETPMVGREAELTFLQEILAEVIERNKGRVVTVLGEAGVGKTRLVFEFQNWLELLPPPRICFFQGRGRQTTRQQPFSLMRDIFTFRFEILDSDQSEIVWQKIESGFGEIFGTDQAGQMRAHFIGQLLGFDFSNSPHLKAVQNDHQQLHDRASAYIEEYFYLLTEKEATVMVIEDLHWADDGSLKLIDRLGSHAPQQRLLIVCLARTSLFEFYPKWGADPQYHARLELSPLSMVDSSRLVKEILRKVEHVPTELNDLIVSRSEGNPFFIEELIKMLVETGVILKGDQYWQIELERLANIQLPETLTGVLQSRLDSLPSSERRLLQIAAVIGKDFWDGALRQIDQESGQLLQEDFHIPIDDSLASLDMRELIHFREESTFSENREYSFNHILFRDVAYETTLKRERRIYHGLVADWLSHVTKPVDRSGEFAAIIADHYLQAEKIEQASEWFYRAGLSAKSQVAMREACTHLTQALELLPPDDLENRWPVLLARDLILGILGDIEARKSDDQALISIAQEMGDDSKLASAYYRLGYSYNSQGQYKNALQAYEEALSAARRSADRRVETSILALKVVCLTFLGEADEARETADLALRYARELGDEDTLAKTLSNVSVYYQLVDFSRAVLLIEEAIDILDRLGEHNLKATSMINLGYIYTQAGHWEHADSIFQGSLELANTLENPRLIAYNQLNLGLTYFRLGKLLKARELLQETLNLCQEIQDKFALAACQSYLGLTLERAGECKLAEVNFNDAWERFIQVGVPGYALDAKAGMARCALARGYFKQAREHSREISNYLANNGPQGMEFPILAYLTCADVFAKTGDQERRQQIIEAGYQQLMDRAKNISDPTWRKIYLERVPENYEIQERYYRQM